MEVIVVIEFFNSYSGKFGEESIERVGCETNTGKNRCHNCWWKQTYKTCLVENALKKGIELKKRFL